MVSEEYLYEYINNNTSGKMSNEKHVSKNYPDDYEIILNYTKNLDLPFKQKVYHTIKEIDRIVCCKNPGCENLVNFKNSTHGYYDYCSNKCAGSDPNMIKRKEEKSLKKYGTKTPAESKEVKDKIIKTNNELYGGNSPMCSKEILEKSKKTLLKNWGVDNPNKSDEIVKKRVKSFKANIDKWKESYKKTSIEKYGVEHPWQNKEILQKGVNTSFKKRKNNYIRKIQSKLPKNYTLIDTFKKKDNLRITSIIHCHKCDSNFEIDNNLLYDRTIRNRTELCAVCNPVGKSFSGLEKELVSFIQNNYEGEIILNSRDLINPFEIDIYLPGLNLAFEFNGLYWHSELNKDRNYHYMKTKLCDDKKVQLIHIWEDDWFNKEEIVKSMILNKLNKTHNRIYGRKCEVKEVTDTKLIRKFLDQNHIQGYSNSRYKIGLYYKGDLVSLMTFSKPRKMMGQKMIDNEYELARFCNKLNYTIIGGASKLFKYFIRNYNPDKIISFSDNSYSNGNLYNNLGFEYVEQKVKLNYYWVLDKKRHHRYNFRKQSLVKMGYDINKSEAEIMYEDVGAFRIWGSGNKKWVFNN
jgi:hypothetical protein